MSKRINQIFSVLVFCIVLSMLITPVGVMAQRNDDRNSHDYNRDNNRDDRRDDNRDNRNNQRNDDNRNDRRDGRNDDSSRYERRYTRRQVAELINRIETGSNRFRRDLDHDLDRSRLDGSRREDNINIDVKKFEEAFNQLRSEFDRNDRWWETRKHVETSLDAARPVAVRLRNNRMSQNVQNQWRNLRRDLNQLATRYNLPPLT